jgi:hypothetical protein
LGGSPVREVLEPRVLANEREPDGARRTVALLADDQLGDAGVLFVGLVDVLAVNEEDDVRVLLERARLAQVRELRAMVRA